MMKPDVQATFWQKKNRAEFEALAEDPRKLLRQMDADDVERVGLINYVSPDVMGFTAEVNEWMMRYAAAEPARLIPFGSVHPGFTDDPGGETDRVIGMGARALKIHPPHMVLRANAYLDGFSDKFTAIPWGVPCARLEGGAYTNRDNRPDASCEVGMPPGVLYLTNRDYLVDEEKGTINVFMRFGSSETGGPDSHTFRYVDGKFRQIHTLTAIPGPQADANGAIVRGAVDPNAD